MNKIIFWILIFTFMLFPVFQSAAQNTGAANSGAEDTLSLNNNELPQWVKDFRRWDIIAFGTFPFSMFFASFFTDLYRWNNANGMDFSSEGRRYAPWPFKSAGAVNLTSQEFKRNIILQPGFPLHWRLQI